VIILIYGYLKVDAMHHLLICQKVINIFVNEINKKNLKQMVVSLLVCVACPNFF